MSRPETPDLPEHKPVAEMTPEEQREYAKELRRTIRRVLAELNRPKRERMLRAGRVVPRNRQEWELFAADRLPGKQDGQGDAT